MDAANLDALMFPQMIRQTPSVVNSSDIVATTVDEINILGTPGITVPAANVRMDRRSA